MSEPNLPGEPAHDEDAEREVAESLRLRQQVHHLVALNPNYFGNMPEIELPPSIEIIADTFFEEATCVAFNPERT